MPPAASLTPRPVVILRDDDANAHTPVSCLETLYRPFIDRGLAVNLAVIPEVCGDALDISGEPEGFLLGRAPANDVTAVTSDSALARWIRANPSMRVLQHGYRHEIVNGSFEFQQSDPVEVRRRLRRGREILRDAGWPKPAAFVAPQDRLSPIALREVARDYDCVSCSWYPLASMPPEWWPSYLLQQKLLRQVHYRVSGTLLLTHGGWMFTDTLPPEETFARTQAAMHRQRLSVVVVHWWEFFPGGRPNADRIDAFHRFATWLGSSGDMRVLAMDQVADSHNTPRAFLY